MKDGSFTVAAIAAIVLVVVALLLKAVQPTICPHPVYSHGGMVTESCDGQMPALEGTPAPETKR